MNALRTWGLAGRCVYFACCLGFVVSGRISAASRTKAQVDPWQSALAARQRFEANAGPHTADDYARVLNGFRAIYHADPSDVHAPRAVAQVAELLAEEGRELRDPKATHNAARQYEFLADQYPSSSLAPEALGHAASLLQADASDAAEAGRVQQELRSRYPKYARYLANAATSGAAPSRPAADHSAVDRQAADRQATDRRDREQVPPANQMAANTPPIGAELPVSASATNSETPDQLPSPTPREQQREEAAPHPRSAAAQVTGIRHWSTSTYTRVAIDLGDEVQYQAARVENPDRIFFDLHHAHLAPQLAGKSFLVTDDGFLTKIRAAQFSDDVTRVVLDVHEVSEYSAFLLPNPYRLIIDIHGKRPGEQPVPEQQAANMNSPSKVRSPTPTQSEPPPMVAVPSVSAPSSPKSPPTKAEHYVPRSKRTIDSPPPGSATDSSGLPPMPVTDGSAAFGLPVKRDTGTATAASVAPPRVVITSKPTTNKPVPNTITTHTSDSGTAVAAVSRQPGKVEATSVPTSQPIAEKAKSSNVRVPAHVRGTPAQAAPPTADGETSLVRALGLKIGRIVIDAGHGGHDSGTLGVDGIEEKDVVLDVALRLGRLLHDRIGAEIVYTRADDTFIPLETRTAIANKAQADLFISVHANSSPDESVRGVEVYYLNFTSDPDAMRVASRENAVSSQSVHELSDLVKKIALKDKIEESRELAADVDETLYRGLAKGNDGLRNRGVKKAPFVVLIGANMPSILAEISFVTNPTDAEKLSRPEYRQRVAESLYGGVAKYAESINGRTSTTERAATAAR